MSKTLIEIVQPCIKPLQNAGFSNPEIAVILGTLFEREVNGYHNNVFDWKAEDFHDSINSTIMANRRYEYTSPTRDKEGKNHSIGIAKNVLGQMLLEIRKNEIPPDKLKDFEKLRLAGLSEGILKRRETIKQSPSK